MLRNERTLTALLWRKRSTNKQWPIKKKIKIKDPNRVEVHTSEKSVSHSHTLWRRDKNKAEMCPVVKPTSQIVLIWVVRAIRKNHAIWGDVIRNKPLRQLKVQITKPFKIISLWKLEKYFYQRLSFLLTLHISSVVCWSRIQSENNFTKNSEFPFSN